MFKYVNPFNFGFIPLCLALFLAFEISTLRLNHLHMNLSLFLYFYYFEEYMDKNVDKIPREVTFVSQFCS